MRLMQLVNRALGGGQEEVDPVKDASWVGDQWQKIRDTFKSYHQTVWLNVLLYAGILWVELDKQRNVYTPSEPEIDWLPQPEINRFAPAADTIASNFNRVPDVEAVAAQPDDEEAHAISEVATALAQHFIDSCALQDDFKSDDDKPSLASLWFVLAGTVFTEVWVQDVPMGNMPLHDMQPVWRVQCTNCDFFQELQQAPPTPVACPRCQTELRVDVGSTQVPKMGPDGQPMKQPIFKKVVRAQIGSPLSAMPRPGSRSIAASPYLFWAERAPLAYVKWRWGLDLQPDELAVDGQSTAWQNVLDYYYQGYNANKLEDACLFIRVLIPPQSEGNPGDPRYPEGAEILYANEKVQKVLPWEYIDHPFTKANYGAMPTLFFGRTPMNDVAKIQKEINHYESLIKLHAMTTASDPWIIDEQSQVSEITGRGDVKITYNGVPGIEPPHRAGHGTLDEAIYAKLVALHDEIQTITAAVNVFRGEQEGSVTAASAILQLRTQAERQYGRPLLSWNGLWRETVRKAVKLYQAHWTINDIIAVVGEGKEMVAQQFLNCDLDTRLEFVATENGLPRTRDERRAEMLQLADRKMLDVNDPNVREEMFELFGQTGMMTQFNADATRARMENKAMTLGQPVQFMPMIEDLAVHFAVHSEFVKDLAFDKLDDKVQQDILQHTLMTKMALDQMMAQQQAAMGAQPPAAGNNKEKKPNEPAQPNPNQPPRAPAAPAAGGVQPGA